MSSVGQMSALEVAPPAALGQAQWYAVQTRPRHEKKVAAELEHRSIQSYLPLLAQVHRWTDRSKIVRVPLFPGYVFVSTVLSPAVRLSVLRVWGVLAFVGPHKQAEAIPASQIESVRTLLACDVPFALHAFPKIGQRVRICGGCLDGVEGTLVDCHGEKRLVISVETIERSLSISLQGYNVRPV
jgi:transcription termination/antitermination protein NusG